MTKNPPRAAGAVSSDPELCYAKHFATSELPPARGVHGAALQLLATRRALASPGIPALLLWIAVGAGSYGAMIGCWRSPLQALYVGIKFPLLIVLTTAGNAALNGMLSRLLGTGLSFRQTVTAILHSFAITAVVLGSLAPLELYFVCELATPESPHAAQAHRAALVFNTVLIGIAGLLGLRHGLQALRRHLPSQALARRVFAGWLAGNIVLGSQLAWNLRPFFGTPSAEVAFLREHPFDGSFFESFFRSAWRLITA